MRCQFLISVIVNELLDVSYGCYMWPSAMVLAAYFIMNPDMFKDNRVLELGAGVCIPGCFLSKLGANSVTFSDIVSPHILEKNIKLIMELNGCQNCRLLPHNWGDFASADTRNTLNEGYDLIIGADLFYDPHMFEDLLATVYMVLQSSPKEARFLTTYQERSSKRNINHLLNLFELVGRQIPFEATSGMLAEMFQIEGKSDFINSSLTSIFLIEIRLN
jgi:methyltransferase-like protein 23